MALHLYLTKRSLGELKPRQPTAYQASIKIAINFRMLKKEW